jgi:hypothetical protein
MIDIFLRIFAWFNVLAGLFFILLGFWPNQPPEPAKSIVVVIVFWIWAFAFAGLAWAILTRKPFARLWTFILYGLVGVGTLYSLAGEFHSSQSRIYQYPFTYGLVYFGWLALSIGPIVFMLRRDVKERFSVE